MSCSSPTNFVLVAPQFLSLISLVHAEAEAKAIKIFDFDLPIEGILDPFNLIFQADDKEEDDKPKSKKLKKQRRKNGRNQRRKKKQRARSLKVKKKV